MSNPAKVKVLVDSLNPTVAFYKDGSASVQSSLVNVGSEFKMKKYIQDTSTLEDVMTVNEDGAVKFHKNVTFAGDSVIQNVQTVILQDQKLEIGTTNANQVNSSGVVKIAGIPTAQYAVGSNLLIDLTKDIIVAKSDAVSGPGYTSALYPSAAPNVISANNFTKMMSTSISSLTNVTPTDSTVISSLLMHQPSIGFQQDVTNLTIAANQLTITYVSAANGTANRLENFTVGKLFAFDVNQNASLLAYASLGGIIGIVKSNSSNQLVIVYTGVSMNQSTTFAASSLNFYTYTQITNIVNIFLLQSANKYQFTATDSNANFLTTPTYAIGNYVHFKGLSYTTGGVTTEAFNTSQIVRDVTATTITVENSVDYTVANFSGSAVFVSKLASIVDNSGISIIGNANGIYLKGSLSYDNATNKNLKLENTAGPISIGSDSSFYGINIGTTGNRAISIGNSSATTSITSGTIAATAKTNVADAILLKTDSGISQTITLNNTTGTATNAILLNAAAGGVQIKVADEKDAVISNSSSDLYVKVSASAATVNKKVSVVNTTGTDPEAILLNAAAGGAKIKVGNDKTLILGNGSDNLFFKVSPSSSVVNDKISIVNTNGAGDDAIVLNAVAGGVKALVANEKNLIFGGSNTYFQVSPSATVLNEKLSILNTVGTAADSININSANGGLSINAGTSMNLANNNTTGAVNIGTLGNRTITMGVNSGTSKIVLDAVDVVLTNGMTASSDVRLKENFESIPNALELVSQLNGTYYTWKKDAGADKPRKLGFIAQEIEKVIPELVKTDSEGMKSVDYIGVVPVLVEALKHQQKQIDELKALLHA